ncbi:MAG: sugar phosphate isomerase/epimerase family protein [Phycisphaerales bacterium JB063]
MPLSANKLAFCSWSTQPNCPKCLIKSAADIGLSRVQLHLDPVALQPEWADTRAALDDAGISVISGMFTPLGEDYTTPATIKATGGVVPDEHWDNNVENFRKVAEVAKQFELPYVSLHAGFIPEDDQAVHDRVADRLKQLAAILHDTAGASLLLETGQETAESLGRFLAHADDKNLGVNFDPANMILYGMGDPIAAMKHLLPHIRQVHLKDATRPPEPGAWGAEVTVGTGEVNWDAFFNVLKDAGYSGDMVIEREAGDDRIGDIKQAVAYAPQFFA